MERILRENKWPNRFEEFDEDTELKHALAALKEENGQLRTLVVRLSETILRNVIAKK